MGQDHRILPPLSSDVQQIKQSVSILPDTGIGSSSSSSGGGGPGGVLGPLGCGLGGLPLNWSSFSPSTIFIVKIKTCI